MKHYYLLFIFLLFSTPFLNAQIVNVPDVIFKDRLLNHNPIIDTNSNGEIEISEALLVTELNVSTSFSGTDRISDPTGLETFVNLSSLSLYKNAITSFDFTILQSLKVLSISDNQFSSIDLSQNTLLTSLSCGNNLLEELDITQSIQLKILSCRGNNISTLNLSNNTQIETLYLGSNPLTEIDLSQNVLLDFLEIQYALFSEIDLSNNTALRLCTINGTNITNLDVSSNINLEGLQLSGNSQLLEVVITNNSLLDQCFIQGNSLLENINITGATNLRLLWATGNKISQIDLSQNVMLLSLRLENNEITNLNLENNSMLSSLSLRSNLITNLDLSQNSSLETVDLLYNYNLESVNIKNGSNDLLINPSTNQSRLKTLFCPNLQTICVDDVGFAVANLSSIIDPQTIFVEDCSATTANYNLISGIITYDEDNNGCDNILDPNIPNLFVTTSDGTNEYGTFSNNAGEFVIDVPSGNYTTSISGLSELYILDPISEASNFTGLGETSYLDFCATANPGIYDLEVVLLPISEARPGFNTMYQLVYKNNGLTVNNGSVSFQFNDTQQAFVSASQTPTTNTVSALSFDFTDLAPFETRTINVIMNTFSPPIVNGDDVLNLSVAITPNGSDITPENNTYNLEQIVVNSYDPNDKQVLQGSTIVIEEGGEYLDYLIRFQNTGTASAIKVAITDQLNSKLDWATLQPISASHSYYPRITNGNFVEFIFNDINLPAEQDDAEGSNGFVAFRIKPKSDVVVGNIITGNANIYFDFNAPIITNTVSTEIVAPLSVDDLVKENDVSIYPNPTKGRVNLELKDGIVLSEITVVTVAGREVLRLKNPVSKIDMSKYPSGIYFIKLKTNRGIINKRIIKN